MADGRTHRLMQMNTLEGSGSCRLCGDVLIVLVPCGPNGEKVWVCPANDLVQKYKASLDVAPYRSTRPSRANAQRSSNLWTRYGLSHDDYALLLALQDGLCAICKTPITDNGRDLHVDHCHDSNRVRGLLCFSCNAGLGSFKDDVERLQKAIDYLEMYAALGPLV